MSNNSKYTKADFIRFTMSILDSVSSDKENAKEYLSSEGLNVESIVSEGIKKIRKIQLKIDANKTRKEMIATESLKNKVVDWVEKLLMEPSFSFNEFIKSEQILLNFRNLESLTVDDKKDIMVKHYTIKFLEEENRE